jgi:hypothetical protein
VCVSSSGVDDTTRLTGPRESSGDDHPATHRLTAPSDDGERWGRRTAGAALDACVRIDMCTALGRDTTPRALRATFIVPLSGVCFTRLQTLLACSLAALRLNDEWTS